MYQSRKANPLSKKALPMTDRQATANRANALKSTGPKTEEGKAVVATNGIRHGILSSRLLLESERPEEFAELADSLQAALRPSGALEVVLVDKIATAIWRQRRLVAAEAASIELARRLENQDTRRAIEKGAGLGYGEFDSSSMAEPSPEDAEQGKWCREVLAEFDAIDNAVVDANDCKRLEADAPLMFGQLSTEAEQDGEPVQQYIGTKLREWAEELEKWCRRELAKEERRPVVQMVAALVQQQASAPVSNELLGRYQAALDGELYKAIRALREQQQWRLNNSVTLEEGGVDERAMASSPSERSE